MRTVGDSAFNCLFPIRFSQDLVFNTTVQYKLEENEATPYNSSADNLIIVRAKDLKGSFIPVKITAYSLVDGISITVKHPISATEMETTLYDVIYQYSAQ